MNKGFVHHETFGKGEFIRIEDSSVIVMFHNKEHTFALKSFNAYFNHNIDEINKAIRQLNEQDNQIDKQEKEKVKNIINWYGERTSGFIGRYRNSHSRQYGKSASGYGTMVTTHCWKCKEPLSYSNRHCSECHGTICPNCGACFCGYRWW